MSAVQTFALVVEMDRYIGHPFWPETSEVINVQKKSGMNMARTEDTRAAKLKAYLKQQGLTQKDYDRMVELAARPWYRVDNLDSTTEIVIPSHQISGCLVQACKKAPAGAKLDGERLRSIVHTTHLTTGRTEADAIYDRYVRPVDAQGRPGKERRPTLNEYLEGFTAHGTVEINPDYVKPEQVKNLVVFAFDAIGVGACRKMGYGLGRVVQFGDLTI